MCVGTTGAAHISIHIYKPEYNTKNNRPNTRPTHLEKQPRARPCQVDRVLLPQQGPHARGALPEGPGLLDQQRRGLAEEGLLLLVCWFVGLGLWVCVSSCVDARRAPECPSTTRNHQTDAPPNPTPAPSLPPLPPHSRPPPPTPAHPPAPGTACRRWRNRTAGAGGACERVRPCRCAGRRPASAGTVGQCQWRRWWPVHMCVWRVG